MKSPIEILAADIGGTSSRFARYRAIPGNHYQLVETDTFATGNYGSFIQLLEEVGRNNANYRLDRHAIAVFGVPGPVIKSTEARLTNVPWDLDITGLNTDTDSYLVNDFEAQAFGCLAAEPSDFIAIKLPEQPLSSGLAVVGAGTGVGHCAIKLQNGAPVSIPSEAGQIPFPFHGRREYEYLDFVMERLGGEIPNGDRIVSGQGLSLVHQFLSGESLPPAEVAARLDTNSETCQWFGRFYARLCRNFCLSLLPIVDTLFVSGGVAVKNPFLVNNHWFLQEFIASGTKARELDAIAIRLANTESLGLLGAAHYGCLRHTEKSSKPRPIFYAGEGRNN